MPLGDFLELRAAGLGDYELGDPIAALDGDGRVGNVRQNGDEPLLVPPAGGQPTIIRFKRLHVFAAPGIGIAQQAIDGGLLRAFAAGGLQSGDHFVNQFRRPAHNGAIMAQGFVQAASLALALGQFQPGREIILWNHEDRTLGHLLA